MTALNSREIELFRNLSQFDLGKVNYDFHNDFNCIKILFEKASFILIFKSIADHRLVSVKFGNALIESFEFSNFEELRYLTIDNIYRGRFQKNNDLLEFNLEGKSFFYIEFYEGLKVELWCDNIIIDDLRK